MSIAINASREPCSRIYTIRATAAHAMEPTVVGAISLTTSPLSDRAGVVERRTRLGDWELDTIIGKGHHQALGSLTERTSRLRLIAKAPHRCAEAVAKTVLALLKSLKLPLPTLTSDNGREFAQHETIAKALKVRFFFAHPYAAWDRWINEITNGLIRQSFPTQRSFATITEEKSQ